MTDPDDDDDLRRRLRQWTVARPDDAARDRMIAAALRRAPAQAWHRVLPRELERGLSDWRYGLLYKAAAAVVCLLLGLCAGFVVAPAAGVANIALIANLETPS